MRNRSWFWGIFFILAAIVILLSGFGYFTQVGTFSLICSIFLVAIIIKSCLHLNFSGILFPMAILAIIYAEPLGITNLTPWPVLAIALFGSIGLSILFGPFQRGRYNNDRHKGDENFDQIVDIPDENIVNFRTTFGGSIKYINTENFQKANISCSFGAMKVYFDKAKIQGEMAEINLDVSFSGVELYIPKEWKVVDNVNISLGGVEEKNAHHPNEKPVLVLTGKVSLGGVEIIYI